MSDVTRYETWEEFPSCRLEPITATGAPAGIQLVAAEDYDRLQDALKRTMQENSAYIDRIEDENDRLLKALRGLVETTTPGDHLKRLAAAEKLLREDRKNDMEVQS